MLVHGTRFDSREWEGYAERLPQCEVVAVDLPGHGTRAGEPFTLDSALDVIDHAVRMPAEVAATTKPHDPDQAQAIEQPEEPEQPVVLVGHSLGGYLAAEYAHRHPGRLAGLGLVGAAADPSRHRNLAYLYTGFAALLPVVGAERMARFANRVIRGLGVATDALPGADGYSVTQSAWAAVIEASGVHQICDLDCPVLVVSGQWDQLGIDARHYAAACPGAWVVTVPRATHLFPLTHAAELSAALADLVQRSTPEGCASRRPGADETKFTRVASNDAHTL